jgi:outer membrane protein OmpA-like peptidoglycan-associated protein
MDYEVMKTSIPAVNGTLFHTLLVGERVASRPRRRRHRDAKGFSASVAFIVLAAIAPAAVANNISLESMRAPLFESVDKALASADAVNAAVLAPTSYQQGVTAYRKAESTLMRAGSVDWIRRHVDKAQHQFIRARAAAEVAQAAFDSTIQARNDAQSSEAGAYASVTWHKAETAFTEAAKRLEKGSIKYAQRYAATAEAAYREAELEAIKANYLNETKALLEQAEDVRAKRYAPASYARAAELLNIAEIELNTNRYDTDRPRNLALEAKHSALHAIYVAKLERQIRDKSTSLETVLLEWEASMRRLGAVVDTPIYFDNGEKAAVDQLLIAFESVQEQRDDLAQELSDTQVQTTALNLELTALQEQMGGESEAIKQLNVLLERQKHHRERFIAVESMFESNQANVLRKGDDVIIRMIGLNFDSGAATLKVDHLPLLMVLENAIGIFPESQIVVEGHTDAFGSDAENLTLSQARADTVVQHLLGNMPISPADLIAHGYGESKPVANNETAEGRQRNRRIDIVIQPSWKVDAEPPATPATASVMTDLDGEITYR